MHGAIQDWAIASVMAGEPLTKGLGGGKLLTVVLPIIQFPLPTNQPSTMVRRRCCGANLSKAGDTSHIAQAYGHDLEGMFRKERIAMTAY